MAAIHINRFVRVLGLKTALEGRTQVLELNDRDVNRPGMQFAGFFDYFDPGRIQIAGLTEMTYLRGLTHYEAAQRLDEFFRYDIPCIIISRGMHPTEEMLSAAKKHGRWIFISDERTVAIMHTVLNLLASMLQPRTSVHGVLVDVYGAGILLMGESGIGKSETALELVQRGHRLVADDNVDVQRVSADRLIGKAPELIRHFMEIRGIGLIDVVSMYGVSATISSKSIDLIIKLERWRSDREYDRLGIQNEKETILDVEVPCITIPVAPGRNLAIIVEVAARNMRLKEMNYNVLDELRARQEIQRRAIERGDYDPNTQLGFAPVSIRDRDDEEK